MLRKSLQIAIWFLGCGDAQLDISMVLFIFLSSYNGGDGKEFSSHTPTT
jgi:hypothetical protein